MSAEPFDVCVIGSGPGGGVLSKELAERGAKVALVEAGRMMTPEDFYFPAWPYELPYRGTRLRGAPEAAYPPEVSEAIRYEECDKVFVDPDSRGGRPKYPLERQLLSILGARLPPVDLGRRCGRLPAPVPVAGARRLARAENDRGRRLAGGPRRFARR